MFVAATRARDSLVITRHGEPSRFLPIADDRPFRSPAKRSG
jgi:superfamily I DNA/RNA helicase